MEDMQGRIDELVAQVEQLRKGWLDQAERDAQEIVRLEAQIEHLANLRAEQDKGILATSSLLAANGNKIGQLLDVLLAYRQWEADLILDDKAWPIRENGMPTMTAALWKRLLELQTMREAALAGP